MSGSAWGTSLPMAARSDWADPNKGFIVFLSGPIQSHFLGESKVPPSFPRRRYFAVDLVQSSFIPHESLH